MTKPKENEGIEFPENFDKKSEDVKTETGVESSAAETPKVDEKKEVAVVPPKKTINTWVDAISALPEKYTQLKLDEKRSTIECGFAMQIIKNTTALQTCDAKTIFDAIIYSARIGLTLNPAFGLAYLVPRGGKCCLDIGYRGWCATLKSYGAIKHIDAYVVYEDEHSTGDFYWNPSVGELRHVPTFAKTESEQKKRVIYGAYAKAILPDNTSVYEFIPAWELDKIKKVSAAAKKGFSPYSDWEGEMTRKAPIKRLAKKLLILQNDDRVKAMFEVEKENDQVKAEKKIHGDWIDAEVVV